MMLFIEPPPSQLNQASNENGSVPKFKLLGFPIFTYPPEPSSLNACPIFPEAILIPPDKVPLFPPIRSDGPSPRHQLIKLEGGGTQLCELPPLLPPPFPSPPPPHSCGCSSQ